MKTIEYSKIVCEELTRTLSAISSEEAEELADRIYSAKKIFVAGAGRSGFMMKAFAMRLMHMGFDSHVIGETTTPNTEKGDILLIGSGSGETGSLAAIAKKAKSMGITLGLVTIFKSSTIGQLADVTVEIPAPTPKVKQETGFQSIQPMGSLFEQSLLLFLDSVILRLMEKQHKDSNTMFTKHANLE